MKKSKLLQKIKQSLVFTMLLALVFVFTSCEKDPIQEDLNAVDAHAKVSPASQQGEVSIVELAETDGRFTVLLSLLEQTGLKEMFETGTDQYTVFAPTDAAFAAFLEENPDFSPTQNELINILTYHVTDGRRFSNSVLGKKNWKNIEMLNEGMIYVDSNGIIDTDGDMEQDSSILVGAGLYDLPATNGVIHVISEVLVPSE